MENGIPPTEPRRSSSLRPCLSLGGGDSPRQPLQGSIVQTQKPMAKERKYRNQKLSLFAQSHRRVEIRRASRRQPARYCGDQEEDHRHRGESHGVGRFHTHQHCGHAACKGERGNQTGGNTDGSEAQPLPHDQVEDLARPGAQSHANADFRGALTHDSGKNAVKPTLASTAAITAKTPINNSEKRVPACARSSKVSMGCISV